MADDIVADEGFGLTVLRAGKRKTVEDGLNQFFFLGSHGSLSVRPNWVAEDLTSGKGKSRAEAPPFPWRDGSGTLDCDPQASSGA